MSLTQGVVVKLILKYIGGSKIKPNAGEVFAAAKKIVVKKGGSLSSSGLGGMIGDLTSSFSNITDITQSLVQNPLSDVISSVTSNISSLQGKIDSLSGILSGGQLSSLTGSLTSLSSSLTSFDTHTSIVSGLIDNVELMGENQLSFSDITELGQVAIDNFGMTKEEISGCYGSLKSIDNIGSISNSINPLIPGGLSDVIDTISSLDPSDTASIDHYVSVFDSISSGHATELDNLRISDLAAQQNLKLKIDTFDTILSFVPDTDNDIAQEMFGLVATDSFKSQINSLQS